MPTQVHHWRIGIVCSVPETTEEHDQDLMTKPAVIARALRFLRDGMLEAIPEGALCQMVAHRGEGIGDGTPGDGEE